MIKVKIGARTLKTALAILLALIIPQFIGLGDSAGLAATAVIFSMLPSVQESFVKMRDRLIANIIGGVIAYVVMVYFGGTNVTIAAASALLIAILHQLKLDGVIGLSTMTLVNVMVSPGGDLLGTAISRVSATLIGVIITFIVNTFVFPPKYDIKFYEKTIVVTDDSMKYVRAMLRKNAQFPVMTEDLNRLNKGINTLRKYHNYMRDPSYNIFRSSKIYSMLRFLVVSRQSIRANELLFNLAETMHNSENTLNHLPTDLRKLIRERMETLMTAHEQILFKWSGRVPSEEVNFISYQADLRRSFMEAFYEEASTDEAMKYDFSKGNDLLRLMTKIFEYDKKLQQFNKLTNSFVTHQRDDQIKEDYDPQ